MHNRQWLGFPRLGAPLLAFGFVPGLPFASLYMLGCFTALSLGSGITHFLDRRHVFFFYDYLRRLTRVSHTHRNFWMDGMSL